MTKLRVASFFAGIGGFDIGLLKAGMQTVFLCEKNSFCRRVLSHRFPNVKLVGDIDDVTVDQIPEAEVWCGGFPCQDLSLANQGKRRGLQGDRSGLFFTFSELISQRCPSWIILENVPGLLNAHQGADFHRLLMELGKLGYGLSWRILDAKYFGTPQRRRRVYIVGSYQTLRSAEVLFEQNTTTVTSRSGRGTRKATPLHGQREDPDANLYTFQHAGIGRKASAGPQGKGYRNDGQAYTLDSRGSADAVCTTDDPFRVREVTGTPRGVDGPRYRSIGNAVAVPVIEWIGRRIVAVQTKYETIREYGGEN